MWWCDYEIINKKHVNITAIIFIQRCLIGSRRIFDSTLIVLKPIECQQAVSRLSQLYKFFSGDNSSTFYRQVTVLFLAEV